MNRRTPPAAKPCKCGGHALRMEENKAVWLRCSGCGRETPTKTTERTEAVFTTLINEWNSGSE